MSHKPLNVSEAILWIERYARSRRLDRVYDYREAVDYLLHLEQPQETEATEEPEPADDFARHARRAGEEADWQWLDRPKLFACTHGHCYYCKVCKFRMRHPWSPKAPGRPGHLDPELARVAARRSRRQPKVCTCPGAGGFSANCPYHGHKVDRTPIGC